MSISVLVLTLNEEVNLRRCLETVSWSDDIVVFDSFSSDSTVAIAREFGARVIQRHPENERLQREASLKVCFKHEWVFNPDADEVPTPELVAEMTEAVKSPGDVVAFRVRFKNMFMGKWIRHSSLYPTWVVRLFKPEHISLQRTTNLTYVIEGREGRLHNHLIHYSFEKGLHAWFDKHNRYSTHEAYENMRSRQQPVPLSDLLRRDPVRRRKALKEMSSRMPFRPTLRFLYMYFIRAGFLDGCAGYTYCRLLQVYERLIVYKVAEMRQMSQPQPGSELAASEEGQAHVRF
jgi:glycosyltransferase involved in cell wall biosynthesis